MHALKLLAQVFGTAFVLAGGLFTLQGLGIVMWPETSSMLANRSWVFYGAIIVAVGIALFWWGSRRRV